MVNRWVIGISVVFLFWMFGFYPFHWESPSHFQVAADGKGVRYIATQIVENAGAEFSAEGLHFATPGIAFLPNPPVWLPKAIEASSLDVELKVRPAHTQQYGPARIFTISKDIRERNLTIGQQGSDLILRVRRSDTNLNGLPSYKLKNVFSTPGTRHISLRLGRGTLKVRINGKETISAALPQGAFSQWSPNYKLAFGNELTFNRPWLGNIYQATVGLYNETINYIEPETLYIPSHFEIMHERYFSLTPFAAHHFASLNSYVDWVINFTGFFVLGLLIIFVRGRTSSVLVATLLCAALSLSIEVGQLFFEGRVSSPADLILNTMGGLFGAWIGKNRHVVQRNSR